MKLINNSATIILLIFVFVSIMSFFFVINTKTYNGDYLGVKTVLSQSQLCLNLVITVLPLVILYYIYEHYRKKNNKYKITVPIKFLAFFVFICLVLNILVTVIYGVGKMGREIYEAPKGIKLFIQILLRFNPSFGVFLYSIMTCKGNKFKILLFMLLIIMSLLKGSLGVFPSIGIFMIIQYYDKIKLFIRKYLLIMVVIIVMFPTIIRSLYTFREYLRSGKRTESYSKIEAGKIVTGVLIGRLSSFSNSAIIMERKTTMIRLMQDFSSMQYIKESLTSIYGGFIDNKKIAYTNIMLESQGVHTRISSFMLGTQGVLLLSLYQSMAMFLINLGVKLSFIILTFNLTMMINNEKIKVLLFSSFCSTVLSGVGREYMSCLITVIIYLGLFLFVNMIEKNC